MDQEKSIYFHSKEKGCKLIEKEIFARLDSRTKKPIYIKGQECLTHGLEVCRCGWEFGNHLENCDFLKEKNIKEFCVSCGKAMNSDLVKRERSYKEQGNYCKECCIKINSITFVKKVIEIIKSGNIGKKSKKKKTPAQVKKDMEKWEKKLKKFKETMKYLKEKHNIDIEYIENGKQDIDKLQKILKI